MITDLRDVNRVADPALAEAQAYGENYTRSLAKMGKAPLTPEEAAVVAMWPPWGTVKEKHDLLARVRWLVYYAGVMLRDLECGAGRNTMREWNAVCEGHCRGIERAAEKLGYETALKRERKKRG